MLRVRLGLVPVVAVLAFAGASFAVTTGGPDPITDKEYQARFHAAVKLHDEGRYKAAIAAFRDLLAVRPDDPTLHCELANSLTASGKPEEAVLQIERVQVKQESIPPYCSKYLGAALGAMGGYDGPTELLRDDSKLLGCSLNARKGKAFYRVLPDMMYPDHTWTILVDRSNQRVFRLAGFREDDASEVIRELEGARKIDSHRADDLARTYLDWTERAIPEPLNDEDDVLQFFIEELSGGCDWFRVGDEFENWYLSEGKAVVLKAVSETGSRADGRQYSVTILIGRPPGWHTVRPMAGIQKWVLSVSGDGAVEIEHRTQVVAYPLFGPGCFARYDEERDVPRPRIGDE